MDKEYLIVMVMEHVQNIAFLEDAFLKQEKSKMDDFEEI